MYILQRASPFSLSLSLPCVHSQSTSVYKLITRFDELRYQGAFKQSRYKCRRTSTRRRDPRKKRPTTAKEDEEQGEREEEEEPFVKTHEAAVANRTYKYCREASNKSEAFPGCAAEPVYYIEDESEREREKDER